MDARAQIGPSIVITGEVTAEEDLIVAGRIEGTIQIGGHMLLIAQGGHVSADVEAKSVVVSGSAKGSLVASERIEVQAGADVEGQMATPRLKMADGAIFHGKVEMPSRTKLALAS